MRDSPIMVFSIRVIIDTHQIIENCKNEMKSVSLVAEGMKRSELSKDGAGQ